MLGLAVVALFLLYYLYGGSTTPAGQPPLLRLNDSNLAVLKDAFNFLSGTYPALRQTDRQVLCECCCWFRQLDQFACRGPLHWKNC